MLLKTAYHIIIVEHVKFPIILSTYFDPLAYQYHYKIRVLAGKRVI